MKDKTLQFKNRSLNGIKFSALLMFICISLGTLNAQGESLYLGSGSTQYAWLGPSGSNNPFDFNEQSFSIEAWIRPSSFGANAWSRTIVGNKRHGQTRGYVLRYGSNNRTLNFTYGDNSGWREFSVSNVLTLDVWQHVAVTYFPIAESNTSRVRLYVNGVLVGERTSMTGRVRSRGNEPRVGWDYENGRFMDGHVDEIRIWSGERTRAQIADNRFRNLASGTANLMGYYKLNRNLNDSSGNARHGGLSAGIWSQEVPFYAPYEIDTNQPFFITRNSASIYGHGMMGTTTAPASAGGHVWNTTTSPTISNNIGITNVVSGSGYSDWFRSDITGLSPNTLYYVRAYVTNPTATSYSIQEPLRTLPTFATNPSPANNAYSQGLSVNMSWTAPTGGCTGYRVFFGTNNPPTNIVNGTTQTGTTFSRTNLSQGTTYYWRVVPYNTTGDAAGVTIWRFTTAQLASVNTNEPRDVTFQNAVMGGAITSMGAPLITQHGHVWAITGNPTVALSTKTELGERTITGDYESDMTGLNPDTRYYVRAYATNMIGTSYGNQVDFWTLTSPPLLNDPTSVTTTGFTANWDPPHHGVVTSYQLDVSTNSVFSSFVAGYNNLAVEGTSQSVTGLSAGRTYYYRVRAVGQGGPSQNSDRGVAVTLGRPIVTTEEVTNITASTARGRGNVTSTGNPNPTQHGHVWSFDQNPTIALPTKTQLGERTTTGAFQSDITGLVSGALYYVRAYATNTYGTAYGSQRTFVTRLLPATSPSPAHQATDVALSPELSWEGPPRGLRYKIYFGIDNPPATLVQTQSATTYQLADLRINTTYYWRIVPTHSTGDAQNCPVWSFTTDELVQTVVFADDFSGDGPLRNRIPEAGGIWRVHYGNPSTTGGILSTFTGYLFAYSDFTRALGPGETLELSITTANGSGTWDPNSPSWGGVSLFVNSDERAFVGLPSGVSQGWGTGTTASSDIRYFNPNVTARVTTMVYTYKYNTGEFTYRIGNQAVTGTIIPELPLNRISVAQDSYPVYIHYNSIKVAVYDSNPPNHAATPGPANEASDVSVNTNLDWSAPAAGSTPIRYKLFFGTDNPPTNLVDGTNLGITLNYDPPVDLLYDTTYYWKIVPTNYFGDAADCPVWSFTTTNSFTQNVPSVGEGDDAIQPQVRILDITGEFTATLSSAWNPEGISSFPNVGLYIKIEPQASLQGRTIEINPDLGFVPAQIAYRLGNGEWVIVNAPEEEPFWTAELVFFTIPLEGRNEDDVEIIFPPEEGQTLPVELSSFTASVTAQGFVRLQWVTETETNMLGYNVYRAKEKRLADAVSINRAIIPANNTSLKTTYKYNDEDVVSGSTYYYWLQSMDLDLTNTFYGPISVQVAEDGEGGGIEPSELITKLIGAYPNPFNPGTNLSFSLSEPSKVSISIYNAKGQLVRTLLDGENYGAGQNHSVYWDGKDNQGNDLASGLFMYIMQTDGVFLESKKMILMK